MGIILLVRPLLVAVWFGFCSEQSFLRVDTILSLSLSMNAHVLARVSGTSHILGLGFPHRSILSWSSVDSPKHALHAAPLPGFILRDCPAPAPSPFQRDTPTLFNFFQPLAMVNKQNVHFLEGSLLVDRMQPSNPASLLPTPRDTLFPGREYDTLICL